MHVTESPFQVTLKRLRFDPARVGWASVFPTVMPGLVLVVAVAGGIWLRCSRLSWASLWFDEGYTAWTVSHPVGEVIRIIRSDTAPPLYYVLLRGWSELFGFSEAGMRSMSAVMSVVALLFFILIAFRLIQSAWARASAVVLFCFSFMQIAYAHEARFYTMMTMMEAIDLYLVLLVCERSTVTRWVALTVAWTASLYTNNMMIVYLFCLGLAWLVLPGRRSVRDRCKDAAVVSISTGLLFLPWVPSLLAQTRRVQASFWPEVPHLIDLARTISVMSGVHEQALPRGDQESFLLNVILLLALSVAACNLLVKTRLVLSLMITGVMPILLTYAYSHLRQSIYMDRAFLASGLVMPLLIVLGLDAARSTAVKVISIGGILVFLALSLGSIPNRRLGEHPENWRDASAYALSSNARHRLVVCVSSDGEPLFRYYGCGRDYGPRADVTAVPQTFFALDPPLTMQRVNSDQDLDGLRAKLKQYQPDEVVLILCHEYWGDRPHRTLKYLSKDMAQVAEKQFTAIAVYKFIPRR